MGRLTAEFSAAFSRDPKRKAQHREWDLDELQKLIDLVLENTPESMEVLKRRHNTHRLSGGWAGRGECHVANSGDWLVIRSSNDEAAFFERAGSHDELFRWDNRVRAVMLRAPAGSAKLSKLFEYALIGRTQMRRCSLWL